MRSHYSSQVTHELEDEIVILCGWVHEKRDLGNLKFLVLRDREGFIQITAKKGVTGDDILEDINSLSKESVIQVKGKVKLNNKAPNGLEINPSNLKVINESNSPLPLDVTQKVDSDMDTRLNNRFMDLRKPGVSSIFRLRSAIINRSREYLKGEGFIEMCSPKIIASASEGGTDLFPISYFDKEAFLAQSPQLYKQMLMGSGLDRVFETTTYFRAEEHDTRRHLNEVSAIDLEMAFIESEEDIMQMLERLVVEMIKTASSCKKELETLEWEIKVPQLPLKRFTYDECLNLLAKEGKEIPWGEDIDTEGEKLLGKLLQEKQGIELYFITKYPLKSKPFYTMPDGEKYSRSFDLCFKGVEVSSGGQRIHSHNHLVKRIEQHNLEPENFEYYLKCFQYGMPPHGGFGLGVDRMMMQLLDLPIKEVVMFPRDRHRLTP
ncbi:MAG: aspartate--tRNA(Asn) ligase [Candidatus Altiarchaeales archaeon ex4484_2]|nr:MAG: aspartate--tRNA(Asn) ligase [Candidatus Altiarchaeales archaeon ex4484_2]